MRKTRKRSGRISVAVLFLLLVVMAAGACAAAFMFWPEGDEVFAYIRVEMRPDSVVYEQEPESKEDYDRLINTQMGLLKSPYVFIEALRKPKNANLSIVKQQSAPNVWLENELKVEHIDKSELIKVSMRCKKPEEAAQLVNAIVDAYINNVANSKDQSRRLMAKELEKIYCDKSAELRSKRDRLHKLSEELGVTTDGTPSVQSQLALQDHEIYQKQLLSAQLALNQATASRDLYMARLDEIDERDKSSSQFRDYVKSQPGTSAIGKDYSAIVERLDGIAARANSAHVPKQLSADLEAFRQQFHAWHDKVLDSLRADVIEKIDRQEARIAVFSEKVKDLERQIERHKSMAQKSTRPSVDVEMMRDEVESLEESLRKITAKRERMNIESRAKPRITIVQLAQPSGI